MDGFGEGAVAVPAEHDARLMSKVGIVVKSMRITGAPEPAHSWPDRDLSGQPVSGGSGAVVTPVVGVNVRSDGSNSHLGQRFSVAG